MRNKKVRSWEDEQIELENNQRNGNSPTVKLLHVKVNHGLCAICGHYGDDCHGDFPLTVKTAHSPTRWAVGQETGSTRLCIYSEGENSGRNIALMGFQGDIFKEKERANAAFIVRAVNCHSGNIEAMENAHNELNFDGEFTCDEILKTVGRVRLALRVAIAKAEEK